MSQSTAYIVGDKTNGYVVFDPDRKVVFTFDAKTYLFGQPSQLPAESLTEDGQPQTGEGGAGNAKPAVDAANGAKSGGDATDQTKCGTDTAASAKSTSDSNTVNDAKPGITGNAKSGVVYYSGKTVSYLTDVGNPSAKWKQLPPIPLTLKSIKGICGDLVNGVVIHDGDNIALIKDVFNKPEWQCTAASPRIPIKGIAGDATNGIVIYRDLSVSLDKYDGADHKFVPSVYKFSGQPSGSATAVPEPQIHIDILAGDGNNGYIAFGERQLFSFDPAKSVWTKVASFGYDWNSAAGNPKDGVLAIVGTENFIKVTTDFKQWSLVQAVPAPAGASTAPDDNKNPAPAPATPPAPATASAAAPASAPATTAPATTGN